MSAHSNGLAAEFILRKWREERYGKTAASYGRSLKFVPVQVPPYSRVYPSGRKIWKNWPIAGHILHALKRSCTKIIDLVMCVLPSQLGRAGIVPYTVCPIRLQNYQLWSNTWLISACAIILIRAHPAHSCMEDSFSSFVCSLKCVEPDTWWDRVCKSRTRESLRGLIKIVVKLCFFRSLPKKKPQ